MKDQAPLPESLTATVSFLTPHERDELWRAAVIMADSRGLLLRLTAVFGRRIEALRARLAKAGERFGGMAWSDFTRRAQEAVEDTLWNGFDFATFGLSAVPRIARPKQPKGSRAHRLAAAASGAASGFVGLPGVLFDIPFTTTTILRSIAEIARDSGEDLASDDTRRACLEVLAFGGPNAVDDDTETGYWATRAGVNHFTIDLLIKSAAGRFGLVISDKILAQAVPVAGAVAGGALNYAFTQYYQDMARVTFCLRALDRRTGQPLAIRQCFGQMVRVARNRRRISRKSGEPALRYLPR
jgi:hypothetical protein